MEPSNQQKVQTRTDGSYPIVAVRSSGLALESIIGYYEEVLETNDNIENEDGNEGKQEEKRHLKDTAERFVIRSLVTEEYLRLLIMIANERFKENKRRMERFRTNLLRSLSQPITTSGLQSSKLKESGAKQSNDRSDWEDPVVRRERMRAEGLRRQLELAQKGKPKENRELSDEDAPDLGVHGLED